MESLSILLMGVFGGMGSLSGSFVGAAALDTNTPVSIGFSIKTGSITAKKWSGRRDLNPRHPAPKPEHRTDKIQQILHILVVQMGRFGFSLVLSLQSAALFRTLAHSETRHWKARGLWGLNCG